MAKQKKQRLKKRKDGRYCCRYGNVFFYSYDEQDCLDQREQYKRDLASSTIIGNAYTVEQYAARWVNVYKTDLTTQPYNAVVRTLKRFCDFHGYGKRRIADITPMDIQAFYNSYSGYSAWSVLKVKGHLHGMFASAVGDRIASFDPTETAIVPNGEKGSHRAITDHERKLIHDTDHRFRIAAFVMLYAGLRIGEVMALDIDKDIDFDKKVIHVTKSLRWDDGAHPIQVSPKTKAGFRDVPLFSPLANELQGHHGLVISSVKGKPLTHSAFMSVWKSYIKALEETLNGGRSRAWYGKLKTDTEDLPPWKHVTIRCHDLRHSFATYIRSAGVDLKTAMIWMGHDDQSMLLKIYDHPDEDRILREAQNAENFILSMQFGSQSK